MLLIRIVPATPGSRVWHSTTEPSRSDETKMNLYTQAEKVGMSKVKCKIVIFLEREQGLTKWITIFNIFIYGGIWSHIHLKITFNRSAWRRKM